MCPTRETRHFREELGMNVPESTARRLKNEDIENLKQLTTEGCDDNPRVIVLPKQSQARPLLVGQHWTDLFKHLSSR